MGIHLMPPLYELVMKGVPHTLDVQVANDIDDCYCLWAGFSSIWKLIGIGDDWAEIGYVLGDDSGYKWGAGLRFPGLTIPRQAQITKARLDLTAYENDTNDTVRAYITGNFEPDAASWSTLADYQARRGTVVGGADNAKRTIAQIDWNPIDHWVANTVYQSPDIKSIVQEIINQPLWAPGNHLALWVDDHDKRSSQSNFTRRVMWQQHGSPTQAAKLHIEWTEK